MEAVFIYTHFKSRKCCNNYLCTKSSSEQKNYNNKNETKITIAFSGWNFF